LKTKLVIAQCQKIAIKPYIATSDAGCFAVCGGRETSVLFNTSLHY